MSKIAIYGFPPSTYTQSARFACVEKGVEHTVESFDFGGDDHFALHPFGKMPAMRHGNVVLFESAAIGTYVDRTFDGPALVPTEPLAIATMQQWLSAAIDYLYQAFVKPGLSDGPTGDATRLLQQRAGKALDRALQSSDCLGGEAFGLADIEVAPMVHFFAMSDDGKAFLGEHAPILAWLDRVRARPAFAAVVPA